MMGQLKTQPQPPPQQQQPSPPSQQPQHTVNGKNSILARALQGQHNGTYGPATQAKTELSSSEKLRKLAEMKQQQQQQPQNVSPTNGWSSSVPDIAIGQLASIIPAEGSTSSESSNSMLQRILQQQQQQAGASSNLPLQYTNGVMNGEGEGPVTFDPQQPDLNWTGIYPQDWDFSLANSADGLATTMAGLSPTGGGSTGPM